MSGNRAALTAERARRVFDYDPKTGVFLWRIKAGPSARKGARAGTLQKARGHRAIAFEGIIYLEHRLAWLIVYGKWPDGDLDHKDRHGDHNWIENLRPATDTQNQANSRLRSDNKTGFKGVYHRPGKTKFTAAIRIGGRSRHIGQFDTAEAAHAAYKAAAEKEFGEFAYAAAA